MKNAKLIILAAGLCMSLLAGCGTMDAQNDMPAPSPMMTDDLVNEMTPFPGTGMTEDMLPDAQDGIVKDRDGIIDDADTGANTEKSGRVTNGMANRP